MTQRFEEQQLQLFDLTCYKGLDGYYYIEIKFTDAEIEYIEKFAKTLDMTTNDYINFAIVKTMKDHDGLY
jgi:hypothetical protein